MTLLILTGYHWSPVACRAKIRRRGLRPATETAVWTRPVPAGTRGHFYEEDGAETVLAVCLGTTPSTAWALSGAITADRGSEWDLWEVELAEEDEVHFRPEAGGRLDELRVVNRIPKSRVWHVGVRTVASHWYTMP